MTNLEMLLALRDLPICGISDAQIVNLREQAAEAGLERLCSELDAEMAKEGLRILEENLANEILGKDNE